MKYTTGDYLLIIFDEVGTRIKTEPHGTYSSAKDHADTLPKEQSSAIVRVLYNSKQDSINKWTFN